MHFFKILPLAILGTSAPAANLFLLADAYPSDPKLVALFAWLKLISTIVTAAIAVWSGYWIYRLNRSNAIMKDIEICIECGQGNMPHSRCPYSPNDRPSKCQWKGTPTKPADPKLYVKKDIDSECSD